MNDETATFRPVPPSLRTPLLLGGLGGAVFGLLIDAPILLFALFGAIASWIAVAARHTRGPRVVADAGGLRLLGEKPDERSGAAGTGRAPAAGFASSWAELRLGFGFTVREDGGVQRYAVIADPRGRSFAFAELAGGGPCRPIAGADGRPVPVTDLREAALLLGLIVQRCPAWQVLPEHLRAPAAAGGPSGEATGGEAPELLQAGDVAPAAPPIGERRARVGLLGLVAKLGSKLLGAAGKVGGAALKAVKTTNLGWAAASAAGYSLIFNWKVAVALMFQLFVHEYGHVHAMRRSGMKVRGIYFIPFAGALAVTEDSFASRRQQAYVALNGPIWGSMLIAIPVALYWWTQEPVFAAVASLWALINLFNLLPITPLDGGRVMQSFAYSYSSNLGLAVSVAGLCGAVALGTALGFSLIWILAALGAMELLSESQARAGARALRLLPAAAHFGPAHWLYLRAVAGPAPGQPGEGMFLHGIERAERAARAAPMRWAEIARWGLAYAGLAVVLVLLVWVLRDVPGAGIAAGILE